MDTSRGGVDIRSRRVARPRYLDESCAKAIGPACLFANNSYPYVETPVFVIQATTDKVVLTCHDQVPDERPDWSPVVTDYLQQWHDNMTAGLAPILADDSPDGAFAVACFIHTSFPTDGGGPLIDGQNFVTTFGNWYFGREGPSTLIDDCGIMCNPTCPDN